LELIRKSFAIFSASFLLSQVIKLAPTFGILSNPITLTGLEKVAVLIALP
jgi:hypothetical protein